MKLLFTFILLTRSSFAQINDGQLHKNYSVTNDSPRVDSISQELIEHYSKINSCYLPLLKDPALHYKGSKAEVQWSELFNNSLSEESQYKNRYLVGDFMALNEKLESRGIKEKNPNLNDLVDFTLKS